MSLRGLVRCLALCVITTATLGSGACRGKDGPIPEPAAGDSREPEGGPRETGPSRDAASDGSDDTWAADGEPRQDGRALDPLPEDRRDSAEWHSFGHDLLNHRANLREHEISLEAVGSLERKWSWGSDTQAVTSTPVYFDGTLFFGDYEGYIVAVDAYSGEERWRVQGPSQFLPMITSSASATDRAVYITADGGMVYRLRRSDGHLDWATKVDEYFASRLWSSPLVVEDLVLVGTASQQVALAPVPDFRGAIMALNAKDGSVRWRFELTEGTGVSVTSTAAVDLERKLMFIGTGQQYTGDTPYSDALVALHYATGEYAWHQQFTAGDDYYLLNPDGGPDADVLSSPVLYTADGVDSVAVGDKAGRFFAMDRETGDILWRRSLTVGGRHGGIMSSPAYHDGVIFLCAGEGDTLTDEEEGVGTGAPQQSILFALDAEREGATLWSVELDTGCFAPLSFANGLVYLPTNDGHVRVFDAKTGRKVWDELVGRPIAGGVSIVNGHLYIPHGWDWLAPTAPGGVVAYGLPDPG